MRIKSAWFMSFLFTLALALSACGNATSAMSATADSSAASATSDTSATSAQATTSASNGKKYVYLAGPFFNDEELKNVELAESILEKKGLEYFSPRRQTYETEAGTIEWADEIYETDRTNIDKADAVVVLYYGNTSDTGTAWECGYAAAIGKPIVLVHVNQDGDSNIMMHCSATANIHLDELADYDFDTMPASDFEGEMI